MSKRFLNLGQPVNWASPLNYGLVSWWMGMPNNQGGGTLFDLTRRSPGTLTNMDPSTDWVPDARPGSLGKCLDYDGSNDYVGVPYHTLWNTSDSQTFSIWIKPSSFSNYDPFFSRWLETANQRVWALALFSDAKVYAYNCSDGGATLGLLASASTLTANVWTHVCVTMDTTDASTGKKIYINGRLDASGAMTTLFDSTTAEVTIGRAEVFAASAHYFVGQANDARIYLGAKSAQDVWAIYTDSLTGYQQTLNRWSRKAGRAASGKGGIFRSSIFNSAIIRGVA